MLEKLAVPSLVSMGRTLEAALAALADLYDRRDGPWLDEIERAALEAALEEGLKPSEILLLSDFFSNFRQSLSASVLEDVGTQQQRNRGSELDRGRRLNPFV